jgi:hypothetical protein
MPATEKERRVEIPFAQINTTESVVFQEAVLEAPKRHLSEATKAKISMAKKGRTLSDEARRNIAIGHLGLKESKKTRRKISRSMKKRWADPDIGAKLRNKTLTDEHKNKIRIGVIKANIQKREAAKELEERKKINSKIEEEVAEEDVDLNLWKSAIEENLIGPILNQNLLTKEEIDRIKVLMEAGEKPPEELMDKFSIAVARIA